VIFGAVRFRNKHNNGFIKYGKSFLLCFLITLYAGFIYAVYQFLFLQFFDPSVIDKIRDFAWQKMAENPAVGEEKADKIIEMQKWLYSPFAMSVSSVFNMAFWGAVIGLIASVFIKKEDTSFEAATQNIDNN
jgi:ABC-type sugar transport system permease subunit